jgi:hypothetical protein
VGDVTGTKMAVIEDQFTAKTSEIEEDKHSLKWPKLLQKKAYGMD